MPRPSSAALLAALLIAGCSRPEPPVTVRAVYEKAVFEGAAATFDHEAIPGVMDAMRMDLPLADAALVEDLRPGDKAVLGVQTEPRLEVVSVTRLPDSTRLSLARR